MAIKNQTKEIPAAEPGYTQTEETTEEIISIRDRLRENFGIGNEPVIDYAYLYRYEPGSYTEKSLVIRFRKTIPPDMGEIQERFGGGSFLLQTRFVDPSTPSGFNMDKWYFKIEGRPIFAENEKQYVVPAKEPPDVMEQISKTAELIQKINPGGGGGGSGSTDTTLILATMKAMNDQTLELIKAMSKQSAPANDTFKDDLLKTLLQLSLQKTDMKQEISTLLDITDSLRNNVERPTIAKEITDGIKEAAPIFEPIVKRLMNGIPNRSRVITTPPPGSDEAAPATNDLVTTLNAINKNQVILNENITRINKRMDKMEFDDMAEDVESDLEEANYDLNKIEGNPELKSKFELFAKAIRQVDEPTKLEFLEYYINDGVPLIAIRAMCVMYKAVESGEEFDALYAKLQAQQQGNEGKE